MRKITITIIVLILLSVLWYFISPVFIKKELNEEVPKLVEVFQNGTKRESLGIISSALFVPNAHEVKGKASLIEDINGQIYLRFENFEIINSSDVRVYLSKDFEKNDPIELGPLKGTHGSFNYVVPNSINLELYSKVLVWSNDFGVLLASVDFKK